MKVHYGPAGLKGVTQLMAVGDLGADTSESDRVLDGATKAAGVVALAGWASGSKTVRNAGVGAGILIILAKMWARRRVVAVEQPPPTPTGRW